MSNKVVIESLGQGTDALTGKESVEGLQVAFENESPTFLSWKSFQQLLNMRAAQKQPARVVAVPVGNGTPAVK